MRPVRVGTRGSPLALAQAGLIIAALRARHPRTRFEAVSIRTSGDERPLQDLGTPVDLKRAFTKRIDDALLAGRVDLAVHSLKDVPVTVPDGLVLAAVPKRETPWDVLVAPGPASLASLPSGARIGTSSVRRRAQLAAASPTARIADLHGNIGTRLRRLAASEFDAIVLAEAGLRRLGLGHRISEVLPPEVMTPAIGQGAIAVEARAEDEGTVSLVAAIDDPATNAATRAEREVARRVGGGCNVPLGAVGVPRGTTLRLDAIVASADGRRVVRAGTGGPLSEPLAIARRVASDLVRRGGSEILAEVAP